MSLNKSEYIDKNDDDDDEEDADYIPNFKEDETVKKSSKKRHLPIIDKEYESDDCSKGKQPAFQTDQAKELQKKKDDDLWSSFLSDVNEKHKIIEKKPSLKTTNSNECSKNESTEIKSTTNEVQTAKLNHLFGSGINNDKSKHELNKSEGLASTNKDKITKPKGGLANILSKIKNEPKMSTLEKSKLDWENFKKEQKLEDDLKSNLKSKDS
jgi:hypothetical protein